MKTSRNARQPTNRRAQRTRDERLYLLAFVGLLLLVGGALITWRYGLGAALIGLTCALTLFTLVALLWGILTLIERWTA